jgi:hypothetical protein
MKIDIPLQEHVAEAFAPLNEAAAAHAFPAPGALSAALDKASPPGLVGEVAPVDAGSSQFLDLSFSDQREPDLGLGIGVLF